MVAEQKEKGVNTFCLNYISIKFKMYRYKALMSKCAQKQPGSFQMQDPGRMLGMTRPKKKKNGSYLAHRHQLKSNNDARG